MLRTVRNADPLHVLRNIRNADYKNPETVKHSTDLGLYTKYEKLKLLKIKLMNPPTTADDVLCWAGVYPLDYYLSAIITKR